MNTIKQIYRYVCLACMVMALYSFLQAMQIDATVEELHKYGFLQLLFMVGAGVSYLIYKSE